MDCEPILTLKQRLVDEPEDYVHTALRLFGLFGSDRRFCGRGNSTKSAELSFLIEVVGRRCLFTGDFVWRSAHGWQPGNRSRRRMRASIESLAAVEFDAILGCADYDAPEPWQAVADANARRRLVSELLETCDRP